MGTFNIEYDFTMNRNQWMERTWHFIHVFQSKVIQIIHNGIHSLIRLKWARFRKRFSSERSSINCEQNKEFEREKTNTRIGWFDHIESYHMGIRNSFWFFFVGNFLSVFVIYFFYHFHSTVRILRWICFVLIVTFHRNRKII